MTDLENWIDWLEHWGIVYSKHSHNGITPYLAFCGVEIEFDDDGYYVSLYGES